MSEAKNRACELSVANFSSGIVSVSEKERGLPRSGTTPSVNYGFNALKTRVNLRIKAYIFLITCLLYDEWGPWLYQWILLPFSLGNANSVDWSLSDSRLSFYQLYLSEIQHSGEKKPPHNHMRRP